MRKRSEFRLLFRSSPTSDMSALLFGALVAASAVLGAQALAAEAEDCPLDFSWSNFTSAASVCSDESQKGKCCRFINAFVALSVSHFASSTGKLGVPAAFSETCLKSVSKTLENYGVPSYAMDFCGLGTKILVNCQCEGRSTVLEMLQSPNFGDVISSCELPISLEGSCKRCLSAGMLYIHRLVGTQDNVTLSTCRGATFIVLANQAKNLSVVNLVSCFFGVEVSSLQPDSILQSPSSEDSPNVPSARTPSVHDPVKQYHSYHLTLIPVVGIAITGTSTLLLAVLILLIHQKRKQLKFDPAIPHPFQDDLSLASRHIFPEGPRTMFQTFSYEETKKATNNFESVIGKGGFGTVYRADFGDGLVVAVKRMNKVSEQAEDEFCREMELLGRLHHRHLVSLKGYCIKNQERFLMYEYMQNGSLKDHIHITSGQALLSWQTRLHIAVDIANALEYLHFYCDPPLCHRDIKSSNILLDENFSAKLADFGLAHASRSGSIRFEPVNTDIRGTPGYMDPEYVITQELTEKSDVYSYGVVLLELVTGRRAIQEKWNLLEWAHNFMTVESAVHSMVDPRIRETVDLEQLQAIVWIIRRCTEREGKRRPSIRQVLRLLHELVEEEGSAVARGMRIERMSIPSSSSTSRSYCSRSFLLEGGSPPSPSARIPSFTPS